MATAFAAVPAAAAGGDVPLRIVLPAEPILEFVETRSVTLEWRITGLKTIFESTKGEAKSKCIKSALFDSQRWQIFFYPNSGQEQYTSLYLSCEPTATEKEQGLLERGWAGAGGKDGAPVSSSKDAKGPWKREGKFKFTFEARSLDKRTTFKTMEAKDHQFSDTARNWGYAAYWKRSEAYFNNNAVRVADGFIIACTIVYSPTPPSPPPPPRLLIPKDLVKAIASLFNDPAYSDICFRIRPEGHGGPERRLYAAKAVLAGRSEYFESMFSSGFVESSIATFDSRSAASDVDGDEYEDSEDDWDEDDTSDFDGDEGTLADDPLVGATKSAFDSARRAPSSSTAGSQPSSAAVSDDGEAEELEEGEEEDAGSEGERTPDQQPSRRAQSDRGGESGSFVDAPDAPPSPTKGRKSSRSSINAQPRTNVRNCADNRPRFEVIVTDASYGSFKALLYFLYTDAIAFAPLASTFHLAREAAHFTGTPFPFPTRRSYLLANAPLATEGPGPCSAKAIYRLADKIGLPELKERAYEHIVKSLTVQNITYEVFGSFSLRFEEIKRVEIAFLLEKWNEVRGSPSLRRVFNNIRVGRFPGFEDVWIRILESLEVRVPALALEEEKV